MPFPQGTITEIDFKSKELSETLSLLVYLPASFSPLYKYSLLIVQDGKDYFQMGRLARYSDELIDQKKIENIIIVGSHYKNVMDRRNKYHPSGEQNPAYIRFLAHELVPWIDQEYPTTGMGKGRTLMGDSLAGTVSLMSALKYPNIFGRVILHSPFVNDAVLDAVNNHQNPSLLDVYQVIGKEEKVVEISNNRDFLTPNRKLHQLFKEKGFQTFYDEFDGGHSWKYWQPDVKRALEVMFG
ncbi:alpha/beta hydrolase [Lederbergia wuyishanensis]|uniref:Enterochelin esterase-like enzyme n=1 Tax=Lederbergia wuyishanensis TaxID=1347903 RepID=A0ABU0CZ26_9BACI|nr:alpha/beta hydrolase-fold protein [Lederbergia wuyishanensis]MCJ8006027.1 alpha/beta hydrolase-fold protein [Lederbergia wuyishanensis]MDQ0341394.1 enterochelin esterase-like enzyme [Lederbergia wuyishanensis]